MSYHHPPGNWIVEYHWPLKVDYVDQGIHCQQLSLSHGVLPAFHPTLHPYLKCSAHHLFLNHGHSCDQTSNSFQILHHGALQNNLHNLQLEITYDQNSSILPCWFHIWITIQKVSYLILLFLFFLNISLLILLTHSLVIVLFEVHLPF